MGVRVLIVDDSATMRGMLSMLLSGDPDVEVVGTADRASVARQKIKDLSPDVITLDVEMPGMNGLDFLEKVMTLRPMPVVMVSTLTARGADATIRALEIGAFDCYGKPTGSFKAAAIADGGHLVALVKRAAGSRVQQRAPAAALPPDAGYVPRDGAVLAIGASTGGVEALVRLLSAFPANCPPTLIVQHMPGQFTRAFAERLDRTCLPHVVEARTGAPVLPGHVYLAPGNERHLELQGGPVLRCRLIAEEPMSGHRPSVDRLFRSVADVAGGQAVGAILTGMGHDGALGLKAMRDAGAVTIGQDEASCVVYGMPRVAHALGGVDEQLPLGAIAARLLRACRS